MSVKRIRYCAGCLNRIDPDYCHCGDAMESHGMGSGHSPVPAGCTCGYPKKVRRIPKRTPRPKHAEAVASIAALVDKLDHTKENKAYILRVLVSNLDDACKEARDATDPLRAHAKMLSHER